MTRERSFEEALRDHPLVGPIREALGRSGIREAWLVGGLLRDLALAVSSTRTDVDVAVRGSGMGPAQELARALRGSAFPLDEAQGAWRVAMSENTTIDLIPLRAPTLAEDLAKRDFTINAMALDLLGPSGLSDPLGAQAHLSARLLVACSDRAFSEDPVRVLRAYRFAFGLGFSFAPGMARRVGEEALALASVAPERIRTEFFAILGLPQGAAALRAMERDGVLQALFPFLSQWKGFTQGDYHSHDLLEHSLRAAEAAETLANSPESVSLPRPDALRLHLAQELEAGVSRAGLLKCAAFLHDVAKPDTVAVDGDRVRFLGHEALGGRMIWNLLKAMKLGRRPRGAALNMVAAHLRLFGLAHQDPPTKAARLRYLRDLRTEVPEALLLSLADELATGPEPPSLRAVTLTAREILSLHWEQLEKKTNKPLLRGRDLLALPGVVEGPIVGEILRRVGEAECKGEVDTAASALALARKVLAEHGGNVRACRNPSELPKG